MKRTSLLIAFLMLFAGLAAFAGDSTPGVISTVAGTGTQGSSGDGGPATLAQLNGIADVAVDTAGNLYIAESNAIRKVSPDGVISTVPDAPGGDIAVDAAGNIYIAREDGILKITPEGAVSTLARNIIGNDPGWEYFGALVNNSAGNVYFSYITLFVGTSIYKVNADGTVTVVGHMPGEVWCLAVDSSGKLYVHDGSGFAVDSRGSLFLSEIGETPRIWKVTPDGTRSIVAGDGTKGFSGDGGPATSAQLNSPVSLSIDHKDNLVIADSDNFRVRKVTWATDAWATNTYFAHVAVGGGYSTTFALTNTGDSAISGSLILTDSQGQSLTASEAGAGAGSAFPFSIAPAGTTFLTINSVGPSDPLKTGWARVATSGGLLNGVATFHLMSGGITQAAAGILPSQPIRFATIPIDDDAGQGRLTAYAVANPTNQNLVIKLAVIDTDGKMVDDSVTFTLAPNQQTSRYLSTDVARLQFKGSIVLRAQGGGSFVAGALRQHQTLFTVIPVISGKASCVPD